ncbi:adenosine deaminase 2 [Hyalella azteca]|uniref:Adenosine deaminase n=1 Tax=Hyalella azteca TaxID=294128 RepID=A0A8B7NX61_HYAAZ|nr:adenosine deaminase 2 [Hyalella azteca]XP_018018333.1 adenosine deaminase 2 [Hyalella azteca]
MKVGVSRALQLAAVLVIASASNVLARAVDNNTYDRQREALVAQDYSNLIGSSVVLTSEEELANQILVALKQQELDDALDSSNYPPARNFLVSKPDIERSQVFSFIRSMPKGAVLHGHDTGLTSINFVVQNLTYWDGLYICYLDYGPIFKFSASPPSEGACPDAWSLVSTERAAASSPSDFDAALYKNLTMGVDNPLEAYPDVDAAWVRFNQYFASMDGILSYRAAFEAYHTQTLTEMRDDGVTYLEFRGVLPLLHELDGTVLTAQQTIAVYKNISDIFVSDNPEFFGARFIYGPPRGVSVEQVFAYVDLVKALKTEFPEYIAGFDLVGQEDPGPPLKDFIEPLLTLQDSDPAIDVFYHAAETDWYGEDADENLFDALLLNATRIGHGYGILKHPALMQRARDTATPIEICPVSNQVLRLVEDLRNHPGVALAASGFPMVVSSDDPAPWAALPLSHDFYEAFMALGGRHADLRFLKQLAINSINFSSLPAIQKASLLQLWTEQWSNFITSVIIKYQSIHTNLIPED